MQTLSTIAACEVLLENELGKSFLLIILIYFSLAPQLLLGAEFDDSQFKTNFFQLSLIKTFPQSGDKNRFTTAKSSLSLGMSHKVAGQPWMVSASIGYKNLTESKTDERIYLFTYVQESLYIVRVTHPVYLLFGPELMYIAPSFGVRIPPKNNPSYKKQFAVGAVAKFAIMSASGSHFFTVGADHWRGVQNRDFYATSFLFGINYSI